MWFYLKIQTKVPKSYLHINGRTDVCLFVCLSVGVSRDMEIQTPTPIKMKFWLAYPHLSKEGFGTGLTPPPPPSGPGGPKILKAEGHIFENCLQNKRCPVGCKLTHAGSGTSGCLE